MSMALQASHRLQGRLLAGVCKLGRQLVAQNLGRFWESHAEVQVSQVVWWWWRHGGSEALGLAKDRRRWSYRPTRIFDTLHINALGAPPAFQIGP